MDDHYCCCEDGDEQDNIGAIEQVDTDGIDDGEGQGEGRGMVMEIDIMVMADCRDEEPEYIG